MSLSTAALLTVGALVGGILGSPKPGRRVSSSLSDLAARLRPC